MDEARAFGRAVKATERVRGWVGEACEDAWAQLAMGPPPADLAQAARLHGRVHSIRVQESHIAANHGSHIGRAGQARLNREETSVRRSTPG